MANSMEKSARDPSVAQGVDLHLADARWLVGHHEPIYSSTDVVCAVDSVGNLSFGDQKKRLQQNLIVEIPTSWSIPTIYGFLTPCFQRGVSMSSHLHFFAPSTWPATRFVLFYEATKKVQQEVRESLNLVYRSGGDKRWKNPNGSWSWFNHRKRTVSIVFIHKKLEAVSSTRKSIIY